MQKLPLYAVSYEENEGGGVHRVTNSFVDAVYHACKIFGELLPYENDPARFLEVCADPETIVRVDVYECDSRDEADAQFADALFDPLFHLDNGMDFRGYPKPRHPRAGRHMGYQQQKGATHAFQHRQRGSRDLLP